jgi:hypothetical protein
MTAAFHKKGQQVVVEKAVQLESMKESHRIELVGARFLHAQA